MSLKLPSVDTLELPESAVPVQNPAFQDSDEENDWSDGFAEEDQSQVLSESEAEPATPNRASTATRISSPRPSVAPPPAPRRPPTDDEASDGAVELNTFRILSPHQLDQGIVGDERGEQYWDPSKDPTTRFRLPETNKEKIKAAARRRKLYYFLGFALGLLAIIAVSVTATVVVILDEPKAHSVSTPQQTPSPQVVTSTSFASATSSSAPTSIPSSTASDADINTSTSTTSSITNTHRNGTSTTTITTTISPNTTEADIIRCDRHGTEIPGKMHIVKLVPLRKFSPGCSHELHLMVDSELKSLEFTLENILDHVHDFRIDAVTENNIYVKPDLIPTNTTHMLRYKYNGPPAGNWTIRVSGNTSLCFFEAEGNSTMDVGINFVNSITQDRDNSIGYEDPHEEHYVIISILTNTKYNFSVNDLQLSVFDKVNTTNTQSLSLLQREGCLFSIISVAKIGCESTKGYIFELSLQISDKMQDFDKVQESAGQSDQRLPDHFPKSAFSGPSDEHHSFAGEDDNAYQSFGSNSRPRKWTNFSGRRAQPHFKAFLSGRHRSLWWAALGGGLLVVLVVCIVVPVVVLSPRAAATTATTAAPSPSPILSSLAPTTSAPTTTALSTATATALTTSSAQASTGKTTLAKSTTLSSTSSAPSSTSPASSTHSPSTLDPSKASATSVPTTGSGSSTSESLTTGSIFVTNTTITATMSMSTASSNAKTLITASPAATTTTKLPPTETSLTTTTSQSVVSHSSATNTMSTANSTSNANTTIITTTSTPQAISSSSSPTTTTLITSTTSNTKVSTSTTTI